MLLTYLLVKELTCYKNSKLITIWETLNIICNIIHVDLEWIGALIKVPDLLWQTDHDHLLEYLYE